MCLHGRKESYGLIAANEAKGYLTGTDLLGEEVSEGSQGLVNSLSLAGILGVGGLVRSGNVGVVRGSGEGKDSVFSKGSFQHVFHGEVNKKRKAVSYHHESMMGGKLIEVTDDPNKYGVYRAIVEIDGKNKKVPSTFFPRNWDRVQVTEAIKEAYESKKLIKDNLYEGVLSNSMKIQMRLDNEGKVKTAYPIY